MNTIEEDKLRTDIVFLKFKHGVKFKDVALRAGLSAISMSRFINREQHTFRAEHLNRLRETIDEFSK